MPASESQRTYLQRTYIWDWSTRLFHWLLVILFAVSLGTGLSGDMDAMEWHMYSGYGIIGLLLFRLSIGLFGKDYGRFTRFPLGPRRLLAYVRGRETFPGHNPLGSWMIILLLLSLATQAITGLMTTDEIFLEGPWVFWVSSEASSWAGFIHKRNYYLLGALVVLHIGAVLWYWLVKRDNLIMPMFSGYKYLQSGAQPARPLGWLWLLLLGGVAAALAWALITLP